MKKLGDLIVILDLHRQGLKVAAIARQVGIDRKSVRKYIARGIEVPTYGPRQPRNRLLDPWMDYLEARLDAYPGLSARRLLREICERGYTGGYSTVRDTVRTLRPAGGGSAFAVHFETPPGQNRPRSILPSSACDLPARRTASRSCGYSRWCWASPA